jgi:hypothetical protein
MEPTRQVDGQGEVQRLSQVIQIDEGKDSCAVRRWQRLRWMIRAVEASDTQRERDRRAQRATMPASRPLSLRPLAASRLSGRC